MQIAIDARLILPQMTGIGRYLLGLLSGLREICRDEQLDIWLQQDLPAQHPVWKLASDNLALRRLALRHMDLRAQWLIPNLLRRSQPDLLHYPHFDLPWLVRGNVIVTIHDLKHLTHSAFFPKMSLVKRQLMQAMMSNAVRRAQRVIVVSQFTGEDLARRMGLAPQKIQVVPEGAGAQFFQRCTTNQLAQIRQRYQLAEKTVLTVSERRPHKNIPGLIQAFDVFLKITRQPYQLVIVGKSYGGYREPEMLVEKLALQDKVRFLDYVDDADLPALYQSASVFALLSHYEGFGLPVLEAMASGIPVVASDQTALPEVVGDAGILTPSNNPDATAEAMCALLPGAPLREEAIQKGLRQAAQYTWQRCARQTLAVYREAM